MAMAARDGRDEHASDMLFATDFLPNSIVAFRSKTDATKINRIYAERCLVFCNDSSLGE
jgi:hypothetical protein